MGTKLSHLQECRRRLGWQAPKAIPANQHKHSNTRYIAEEFFPDPKHKASSGSEPSVHPRLPGTTKPPAHPDTILQCTRQICRQNPSKKRVGGEDGEDQ